MSHRLVAVLALWTSSARADCELPNHFDDAERAALVYVARAGSAGGPRGWPMIVETVLEGQPGRQRDLVPHPMGVLPSAGQRYLFFQDAAGRDVGSCSTLALVGPRLAQLGVSEADLLGALRRFLGAADGDARRARLVEAATAGRTELAGHAAERLSRETALLGAVTPAERGQIVRALAAPPGPGAERLAMLAARLRLLEALPHLIALLQSRGQISARLVEDALELMTNHVPPGVGVEHGIDLPLAAIERLQRHWRAWAAAQKGRTAEEIVARGFRERGVTPPKPGALAALVRSGPDRLTRTVAAEALERAKGGPSGFPTYVHGVLSPADWGALADRLAR